MHLISKVNSHRTRSLRFAATAACVGTMIRLFRRIYTSILILSFASEVWGHVEIEAEDYFFPLEPVVNFCKLSEQCQHDFVQICGQDALGIVRMFIDNCDLYEYNCDDKKQYRHVKMDVCNFAGAASERLSVDKKRK